MIGPCCYQAMSKLIIVKSMVGVILYQAPKHEVVPFVKNTLYSINKYSCVRRVHTLYIRNFTSLKSFQQVRFYVAHFCTHFVSCHENV